MKYALILSAIVLSACAPSLDQERQAQLEAERDFHSHQAYMEERYNLNNYDPEYVADCLYYEELVCEFE
jgi:hypothetical protein